MATPRLPDVSSRYGAPMGRVDASDLDTSHRLRLFRVYLDNGGYDEGGAYWGHGAPIYCAMDANGDKWFCRAHTRGRAKELVRERFPDATFFR